MISLIFPAYNPGPAVERTWESVRDFIAVRREFAQNGSVFFDERFDFHFYDLDFCRTARRAGLSIGTWPISLTHQSDGAFGSPSWRAGYERYLNKWRR